jgi:hypothetical protein
VKAGGAGPAASTSTGVSTDKNRNYAVLAGTVAGLRALGWYLLSKEPKKTEEVVDRMGPADEGLPISLNMLFAADLQYMDLRLSWDDDDGSYKLVVFCTREINCDFC